jgi:ParB-like chromosome segregation protein Spo0J
LRLDDRNARVHTPRNLEALVASLRRFGQQRLPLVDCDGVVIAGNGLVMAARQLGWLHIDILRTDLRGDEARAYAIADNRTAELAEWDRPQLIDTLRSIDDPDLIAASGFSEQEFRAFLANMDPPTEFKDVSEPAALDTKCPRCGFDFQSS